MSNIDAYLDIARLITSVCIQIIVVVFSFKLRIKKRYAFLSLIACLFCNIILDYFLEKRGNSFLLALQLDTFLFCIVIVLISGGSIYGQIFFHYVQNLIANCIFIVGKECLVYGKMAEFLAIEFLMIAYLVLMLSFGKEIISAVRGFLDRPAWSFLLVYPVASYYAIRLLGFEAEKALYTPNTSLSLAVSLLAGNCMAILCIVLVQKKKAVELALLEGKRTLSANEAYYQRVSEMLDHVRIIRHDYKHELGIIKQLLGKGEIDTLKKILSVPSAIDEGNTKLYCKNVVVNALLVHYVFICNKHCIPVEIDAMLPQLESEHLAENKKDLTNYDLCIIIGNLFENAIEESIKVEEKDRSISIQIDSDIHKILIKVINTCVAERAKDTKILPITSKKEYAHGLGLKSVKMTCEIFGGAFFWSCENNLFTASAIVNR